MTRTIMLQVTRNSPWGKESIPSDQVVVWRELHQRDFAGRKRDLDDYLFEAVHVHRIFDDHGITCVEGRFYRNKKSDLPLVGGEADLDEPLKLDEDKGLRSPTHFVWWDVSRLPERYGRVEPEGLLAMESTRGGAPGYVALENYISMLEPKLPCRLSIMQLLFKEQWQYLQEHPKLKRISFRIGFEDPSGDEFGATFCSDVDGVQDMDLVLRPARRGFLDILKKLPFLQNRVSSGQRIAVTLPDGRSWYLNDPALRLRVVDVPCAENSRSADKFAMWHAIHEVVWEAHDGIGEALGRSWI